MNNNLMLSYSAFVYEMEDYFMADCSKLNLVSAGITPDEAVKNLQDTIKMNFLHSEIMINPIYERR